MKKKNKGKKVVLVLVILLVAFILFVNSSSKGEKIVWDDLVLSDMLPEIEKPRGDIHTNTDTELDIDVKNFEESKISSYITSCKEMFPVDAEYDSDSFTGYNEDGYKLVIYSYSDLSIELTAPKSYATIAWPQNDAAKLLPLPKSNTGKIESEDANGFTVLIAEMTMDDYNDYVSDCQKAGFDIDYSKYDDTYNADHKDGYSLRISYEGFNTIRIDIDKNDEVYEDDTEEITTTEKTTESKSGIRPEFHGAMDSYEEFMNKYVEFMKKYEESDGSDLSLMADYMLFVSDYEEAMEEFDKWDEDEMSDEEMKYYIEVQARVLKKLDEIS